MDKILVQLERLKNHHNQSLTTYNQANLLDLSHILRIWTELTTTLPNYYPDFSDKKNFKAAAPTKKLIRIIANDQYVLSYLPCGVTTNAHLSHVMASAPDIFSREGQIGIKVNRAGLPQNFTQFTFFDKAVDKYAPTFIGIENSFLRLVDKQRVDRYNYKSWMRTEIVRVSYRDDKNLVKKIISREVLIKRAANILDASHSSLTPDEGMNTFDYAIKYLLDFKCGGLPLVYFLLLSIAQDILRVASQYIDNRA